jgi:hypothetical protein
MASRLYYLPFTAIAVTVAQDVWEITAGASYPCILHGFTLRQSSDLDPASDFEALAVLVKRGATSSGSGGSALTPVPMATGGTAASFSVESNNTVQASGGTISTLWAEVFDALRGLDCIIPPRLRPVILPSERLTIEIAAPGDSLTMHGVAFVEELDINVTAVADVLAKLDPWK